MKRQNVMLDDMSRSAGRYLMQTLGGGSLSAAIRFALFQTAKRKGWKPEQVVDERRRAKGEPDGG